MDSKGSIPRRDQSVRALGTEISFVNNKNELLKGTFVDGGSGKVVVLCHGYLGSRDGLCYPQLARKLCDKHLGTLRFDFSGNGASQGEFEYGNYAKEAGDIRAAVLALRDKGQEVVALVGHSKGANSVLLYASKYDDIPRVVNIAGRFNMTSGITERFGADVMPRLRAKGAISVTVKKEDGASFTYQLTKQSMDERVNLGMASVSKTIGKAEVLTVQGTNDNVIPVEDAYLFASHISDHTLRIIEGAGHSFKEHMEELMREIIAFVTL